MKKVFYLMLVTLTILLSACVKDKVGEIKIIAPSGTPALGLSNYFATASDEIKWEIVDGSDPLVAAFTSRSHDIVVAPVNLGSKFYNNNHAYLLYKTFVWGNTYIASTKEITKFEDLEGLNITAFGESSTPGIVLKALLKYYDINANVTYVADVATANQALLTNKANTILTAEPSLSNVKTKKSVHIIDLQAVWMDMTGSYSYPQAGIFVNASKKNNPNVKAVLADLVKSVNDTVNNPEKASSYAITLTESFKKLGQTVLTASIPNCHYDTTTPDKAAVEFYFNKLSELGLKNMFGGTLPDEAFYLN